MKHAKPTRSPEQFTSRTKLPFLATIRAGGRSYEVEVLERGMRFVRWL